MAFYLIFFHTFKTSNTSNMYCRNVYTHLFNDFNDPVLIINQNRRPKNATKRVNIFTSNFQIQRSGCKMRKIEK